MLLTEDIFSTFFCSLLILASLGTLSYAADTLIPNQTIGVNDSLASLGGTFELGFFSRGASKNTYLGIWYKDSPDTIVWIANRDNPINGLDGALMFDATGNLVILNQTKSVIWSSGVNLIVIDPVAQLLDTGNLVLKGNSDNSTCLSGDNYVWQSFEHPTDTLLPGMKIGWNLKTGRETYLTSWNGEDDPSSGTFTFRLDIHGLPQLILEKGLVEKYRTGPWKGSFFDGLPLVDNHPIFNLMVFANSEEIYHTYEPRNSSITTRIAMNESGLVQRYIKYTANDNWTGIFWTPFDVCDNYAQCGVNGICSTSTSAPCQCLKGFISNAAPGNLDATSWTSTTGCKRRLALNCDQGEAFVSMNGVKLPDMVHFKWNQTLDPRQCYAECKGNCSCVAYANLNVSGEGKGCMMWFGDLIDVKKQSLGAQDLYIRVAASELELLDSQGKKKNVRTILAASLGSVCGVLIFSSIIWFTWSRRKHKGRSRSTQDDGEVPLFEFSTIAAATDGFSESNILGVGGFGTVYKGKLSSGQDIAVKRLSEDSRQGIEEFRNEVTLIAKLQHRNLVSLIGSCTRGEERMLIYEYLPNKSLDHFLFDIIRTKILTWKERFSIALGIARGMLYLHQDSKLHVVHRDLKASNILLDVNLNPKISDFGLARIFGDDDNQARTKRVIGTYGYMSPEYAIDGRFSVKSDVFSFGVLLLEIVSSKRNRGFAHSEHYHSLLGHAWLLWTEGRPLDLVDPNLDNVYLASQALRCIHVGLLCVQQLPEDRPDMSSVVFMLANDEVSLPQPKHPGFFTERSFPATNSPIRDEQPHTVSASHCTITMPEVR